MQINSIVPFKSTQFMVLQLLIIKT